MRSVLPSVVDEIERCDGRAARTRLGIGAESSRTFLQTIAEPLERHDGVAVEILRPLAFIRRFYCTAIYRVSVKLATAAAAAAAARKVDDKCLDQSVFLCRRTAAAAAGAVQESGSGTAGTAPVKNFLLLPRVEKKLEAGIVRRKSTITSPTSTSLMPKGLPDSCKGASLMRLAVLTGIEAMRQLGRRALAAGALEESASSRHYPTPFGTASDLGASIVCRPSPPKVCTRRWRSSSHLGEFLELASRAWQSSRNSSNSRIRSSGSEITKYERARNRKRERQQGLAGPLFIYNKRDGYILTATTATGPMYNADDDDDGKRDPAHLNHPPRDGVALLTPLGGNLPLLAAALDPELDVDKEGRAAVVRGVVQDDGPGELLVDGVVHRTVDVQVVSSANLLPLVDPEPRREARRAVAVVVVAVIGCASPRLLASRVILDGERDETRQRLARLDGDAPSRKRWVVELGGEMVHTEPARVLEQTAHSLPTEVKVEHRLGRVDDAEGALVDGVGLFQPVLGSLLEEELLGRHEIEFLTSLHCRR